MPDLPTIAALAPSSVPAQPAMDYPQMWVQTFTVGSPDPAGKWTLAIGARNYNQSAGVIAPPWTGSGSDPHAVSVSSADLLADAALYPAVGQQLYGLVGVLVNLIPAKAITAQLVTAQATLSTAQATLTAAEATLATTQTALTSMTARLARQQALPDGPQKSEVLPDTQAQIVTLTATVATQATAVSTAQAGVTTAQATVDALAAQLAPVEAALGYVAPASNTSTGSTANTSGGSTGT